MLKLKSVLAALCTAVIFTFSITSYAEDVNTNEIREDYIKKDPTANVFIGDSRTVILDYYLDLAKHPDTFVIAEVGMGYDWLVSDAIPKLKKLQNTHTYKKYNIIFNLGVNDLEKLEEYKTILPILEQYGTVYFVSVNPTIDSLAVIKNKNIEAFNRQIDEQSDRYIDCYGYLKRAGYNAPDGLHYDDLTSRKIYDYVMLNISTWEYLEGSGKENVTESMVADNLGILTGL